MIGTFKDLFSLRFVLMSSRMFVAVKPPYSATAKFGFEAPCHHVTRPSFTGR